MKSNLQLVAKGIKDQLDGYEPYPSVYAIEEILADVLDGFAMKIVDDE